MPDAFHKLSKLAAATVAQIRASAIWQVFDPASPKATDDKSVTFDVLQTAIRDYAGGIAAAYRSVAAAVTVTADDAIIFVSAQAAARTVTLPAASETTGKLLIIKCTNGTNDVTITDGNGESDVVLTATGDYAMIVSDGSAWQLIGGTITP